MSVDNGLAKHGHVSYLEIQAVDFEASAKFYETVFDWNLDRRGPANIAFDDRSGALIGHFVTGRAGQRDAGIVPYVYVGNVDEAVRRAIDNGGVVIKAPYPEGELTVATVHDPAGNLVGIWQAGSPSN
jgi:predicted enzyme related to lactoylglutathione lyase